MNKAVELLVQWDQFNQTYPEASLTDFCRFYLDKPEPVTDNINQKGLLLKTMGRIMSAFNLYHRSAMAEIKMPSSESFFFLNGIAYHEKIKKTDLINYLFFEYTTGMEAINKLLKHALVKETSDPNDKRAKMLSLTEKGKELLRDGYAQSAKVSELIFKDVNADAIQLCNQLLFPIEQKHSKLTTATKDADFGEIYRKAMKIKSLDIPIQII